jgi:hypothetical protein
MIDERKNDNLVSFKQYVEAIMNYYKKDSSKSEKFYKLLVDKSKTDINKIIENFIIQIEEIIGTNININNNNIYVKHDTYIIDHNHLGKKIDNTLIIINKTDDVKYKINDSNFNTDILYYTDKIKNITVYYDAINKNLIGYKEQNKEIVKLNNTNKFIKVNLSIMNKLKILGFSSKYINVDNYYDLYSNMYNDDIDIYKSIINNVIRDRINELKNIIYRIQRIISQIVYGYSGETSDNIYEKYNKKIKKLIINGEINGKNTKIFKHNKLLNNSIFYKVKDIKDIDKKMFVKLNDKNNYMNITNINNYENNDILIINYFIDEILKLLQLNKDKFEKIQIIYLFFDIIQNIFDDYIDVSENLDVKKFKYSMTISSELKADDESGIGHYGELEKELTDEEQLSAMEQYSDDFESLQALDISHEYDPETQEPYEYSRQSRLPIDIFEYLK